MSNCDCKETQDSTDDLLETVEEVEEKSKMYSTMLRNAILAAHFDFMNQEK